MDKYILRIKRYIDDFILNSSNRNMSYILIGKYVDSHNLHIPNNKEELISDGIDLFIKEISNQTIKDIVHEVLTDDEYNEFAQYCRNNKITISKMKQKIIDKDILRKYIDKHCIICDKASDLKKYDLPLQKFHINSTNTKLTHKLKSLSIDEINKIISMPNNNIIDWLVDNDIIYNKYENDHTYLSDRKKYLFINLSTNEFKKYLQYYPNTLFNDFRKYLNQFNSIFSFLKLRKGESMEIDGKTLHEINHEASCKAILYINGNIIVGGQSSDTARTEHRFLLADYMRNEDKSLHKDDIKKFTDEEFTQVKRLSYMEQRQVLHTVRCIINDQFIIIIDGGEFIDEVTQKLSNLYTQPIFAFNDSMTSIIHTANRIIKRIKNNNIYLTRIK